MYFTLKYTVRKIINYLQFLNYFPKLTYIDHFYQVNNAILIILGSHEIKVGHLQKKIHNI